MSNKNSNNEVKCSWDLNEQINLILLSMFLVVVLTILCFSFCSCYTPVQMAKTETLQQQEEATCDVL